MPYSLEDKLVVAVSSRALFNFSDANQIFETDGEALYRRYQKEHLDEVAEPGVAFPLVQKLLRFNGPRLEERRVEVVVLSKNDAVSGLRVFHSAQAHGLDIIRGAFTGGRPNASYLTPFQADLFLSANADDVHDALANGFPAAIVYSKPPIARQEYSDELRIAFDGDGVLFDDESEALYQAEGLDAFHASEATNAAIPMGRGPFYRFLAALRNLRQNPPANAPIRTRVALITARSAPAHERAIRTLMDWQIEIDEAFFLGGVEKKGILSEFNPDFFFDDQQIHCDPASTVAYTGHVPFGVANLGMPRTAATENPSEA